MRLMRTLIRCGAAATALAAAPALAGLVAGFETGLDNFAPDNGSPTLTLDNTTASEGSQSLLVQRSAIGWGNTMVQDPAPLAEFQSPNELLLFDVMATGGPGNDVPAWWLNLTPVIQGDGLPWTQGPDIAITLDGQWHTYSWQYPAVPTEGTWFQLYLPSNTGMGPSGETTFQYRIDNIRTAPIPEPAAMGTLAVAGLLAAGRRRAARGAR